MIVLDDQLSAPHLKTEIEKWYAGSVIVLGSLRPHSVKRMGKVISVSAGKVRYYE